MIFNSYYHFKGIIVNRTLLSLQFAWRVTWYNSNSLFVRFRSESGFAFFAWRFRWNFTYIPFFRFIYITGPLIPLPVKSLNCNLEKKPSSKHISISALPFNPSQIRVRKLNIILWTRKPEHVQTELQESNERAQFELKPAFNDAR